MYFNLRRGEFRAVVHVATRYGKDGTETRREVRILRESEKGTWKRILTIPIGPWIPYGYGSG